MWQNTDDRSDAEYNEWLTEVADAEYDEWLAEVGREEAERDMEPHKREGYAERMYEMADMLRKAARENGHV